MKIISIEMLEVTMFTNKFWFVAVTVFDFQSGRGDVVPFLFDTPQDAEDSVLMFEEIAKYQGGDVLKDDEPFSEN